MKRRIRYLLLIVFLVILEFTFIKLVPILASHKSPLLASLLCIQTESINDLYWNINQIDVDGTINGTDDIVKITLTHNMPNFDTYLFRTGSSQQWEKVKESEINLELREGENIFEVKAKNKFREEIPAATYRIIKRNGNLRMVPSGKKIIRGRYDFRFENSSSNKINWLRQYTLPVVADSKNQWDKYIALRRWVREQIPFRNTVIKSHWDAQRILQTVWDDSTIGFICDAYAAAYASACISVGLNARIVHLESAEGNGHYATEVWSDEFKKWIFMDPLYSCYFTMNEEPLSVLELHKLRENKKREGLKERRDDVSGKLSFKTPQEEYLSLFQDIQLVNSNNFLSSPFRSVFDLLTLKIRYIRWVDQSNPRYNRTKLAYELLLFYYFPKLAANIIIPFFIPLCLVYLLIRLFKKEKSRNLLRNS